MQPLTRSDIETYWETRDYSQLVRYSINDFCRMWAEEEGTILPDNFNISGWNKPIFRINSQKKVVNEILSYFRIPHVETEALTLNQRYATERATDLYHQYGHGVIRANQMAGGGGTFIIRDEKSIPMMISTLLHHPKGPVEPLFSPYYASEIEYGVFFTSTSMPLVIAKHRNPETGLHNLTLGAHATVVTDEHVIAQLHALCQPLVDLFGIGFARIDVLNTSEGLKIVELSVPNFKKFSLQDEASMETAKQLFLQVYREFTAKKKETGV